MENKQLEVIVGLLSGMQLALVHMCKTLEAKGIATSHALSDSFATTAAGIPADAPNRELMQRVLNQIAAGIHTASPKDDAQTYRDLLH